MPTVSMFKTLNLFLVLVLVLVLSSTTLIAQKISSIPRPTAPVDSGAVLLFNGWYLPSYKPVGAEADTTGALLSLFRKRRYAGYAYTIPFMVGMFLAVPISSTNAYGQTTTADEAIAPPLGIPILVATVVGFIVHATSYNKAHLLTVDQAYAAGQPIPAKYRRRLAPQHFTEAAFLREALFQQMQRENRQSQPTLK